MSVPNLSATISGISYCSSRLYLPEILDAKKKTTVLRLETKILFGLSPECGLQYQSKTKPELEGAQYYGHEVQKLHLFYSLSQSIKHD
jgi:hypothetical protein